MLQTHKSLMLRQPAVLRPGRLSVVSEPVAAGDTGCVVISDDSSLLDSR